MPNPNFKAIYNPFNRNLAVLYGSAITECAFIDNEGWVVVNYDDNPEHRNYLHIQLDYDESLQLLFYPRVEGNESLFEDLGTYFNSNNMNKKPKNIKLVFNDKQYLEELQKLTKQIL